MKIPSNFSHTLKNFLIACVTTGLVFSLMYNSCNKVRIDTNVVGMEEYTKKIDSLNNSIDYLQYKIDSLHKIPKAGDEKEVIKYIEKKYNLIILNDDSISKFLRTELSKESSFK